jgi:hypothetical protein
MSLTVIKSLSLSRTRPKLFSSGKILLLPVRKGSSMDVATLFICKNPKNYSFVGAILRLKSTMKNKKRSKHSTKWKDWLLKSKQMKGKEAIIDRKISTNNILKVRRPAMTSHIRADQNMIHRSTMVVVVINKNITKEVRGKLEHMLLRISKMMANTLRNSSSHHKFKLVKGLAL